MRTVRKTGEIQDNVVAFAPRVDSPCVNTPREDSSCANQRGLGAIVEEFIDNYFIAHEGLIPTSGLYDRVFQEVEKPLFRATLKAVQGNQKKAAEILGINRNTLRKRLIELKIDPQAL